MSSEDEAEYERERQEVLRKEKGVVHANLVCNRDTDPDSVMGCQLMRIRRHDVTINSLEFNDLTKIGLLMLKLKCRLSILAPPAEEAPF